MADLLELLSQSWDHLQSSRYEISTCSQGWNHWYPGFCTPKHILTDPSPKLEVCLKVVSHLPYNNLSFPSPITLFPVWNPEATSWNRSPGPQLCSTPSLYGGSCWSQAHCAAPRSNPLHLLYWRPKRLAPAQLHTRRRGRQSWSCLSLCVKSHREKI